MSQGTPGKGDVLVLGAGMVGVGTALHLQRRGFSVALVDRGKPGQETSYGNAGLIQREAVEPYPFPDDWRLLARVAIGRATEARFHWSALPSLLPRLLAYRSWSRKDRYEWVCAAYRALIEHCTAEHEEWLAQAGAADLVRRDGYLFVFRTPAARDAAAERAERLWRAHGVASTVLDGPQVSAAEPALRSGLAGAIWWRDPWAVNDPGELVARYARLFAARGGSVLKGDALSLKPAGAGWSVQTDAGPVHARQVVVALGPWSHELTRRLGYRLPLFVKRGYHRHFRHADGSVPALQRPVLDAERGYLLVPMRQGIRLTTGAEFATLGAPASPVQVQRTEPMARELIDLPPPVEPQPWLGNRPCTPDMLPLMGPAPRHPGVWFNFGHAHQGFTLGPMAGRLIAECMDAETPLVDLTPYRPGRFPD